MQKQIMTSSPSPSSSSLFPSYLSLPYPNSTSQNPNPKPSYPLAPNVTKEAFRHFRRRFLISYLQRFDVKILPGTVIPMISESTRQEIDDAR